MNLFIPFKVIYRSSAIPIKVPMSSFTYLLKINSQINFEKGEAS
jgi:hypothetical protein